MALAWSPDLVLFGWDFMQYFFSRSAMVGDKEVGDLPTIADDLVVTKYKMAAEIVNSKSDF